MKNKNLKISNAEWKIMKVLWENTSLPSSEIIKKLKPYTTWNSKTIHTLIGRLVKKGYIGVNREYSRHIYYPLYSQDECRQKETESFLEKVYNGSLSLLVTSFIKDNKLTKKEIEELKKLLEDKS